MRPKPPQYQPARSLPQTLHIFHYQLKRSLPKVPNSCKNQAAFSDRVSHRHITWHDSDVIYYNVRCRHIVGIIRTLWECNVVKVIEAATVMCGLTPVEMHSLQRERVRDIFIRIKQATKRDMPIKPGAYCLATYE